MRDHHIPLRNLRYDSLPVVVGIGYVSNITHRGIYYFFHLSVDNGIIAEAAKQRNGLYHEFTKESHARPS